MVLKHVQRNFSKETEKSGVCIHVANVIAFVSCKSSSTDNVLLLQKSLIPEFQAAG